MRVLRFLALAVLAAAALSASLSLRGGFPDDNDFQLLSSSVYSWPGVGAPLSSYPTYKELAPRFLLDLAAAAGGLWAVERVQPLLWAAGAWLSFAFLRAAGAGTAAASVGAGLLSLSFLSLLAARSLGTTWANLVLILASLLATARLPAGGAAGAAAALGALFLVLLARFEFAPPLALALAWRASCPDARRALAKIKGRERALLLSWAALLTVLAALWARTLAGDQPLDAPGLSLAWSNLSFQLGTQNLSRLLPLPPAAWPALVALLAALAWRTSRLWAGVLVFWLAWFALIYKPTSPHLLYNARHHLYVFLPVALAAGLAAEPFLRGRRRWAAAALLVGAWGAVNFREARRLEREWRTNDLEWRLLLKARRDWPDGCRAVYPFADSRRGVLRRFFPFAGEARPDGCLLAYRGAPAQIFEAGEAGRNDILAPGRHPYLFDDFWLEKSFEHRFYTNAPNERKDAFPVRVGFYRLSLADRADPRWTLLLLDSRLVDNDASALEEAESVRPADFSLFGADAARLRAKFLSDRAVAKARHERPGAEADLREALRLNPALLPAAASLGALLERAGKADAAKLVYRAALKNSKPDAYPRERALLSGKN